MNGAIIGYGTVGQAVDHVFKIGRWFDLKGSNITLEEVARERYIFICLPTPTVNGDCYTDDIYKIIKQIRDYEYGQNVFIIRSTVSPGTCRHFMDLLSINSIIHVPEFLSEDTWKEDSEEPGTIVIGGEDKVFIDDVKALYRGRYPRNVEIITTDTLTSELAKWAINGFFATKVTYANEVYDYAQKIDANYDTIKKIMYRNKFIGKNHLDVWNKGYRGYAGKCLPKDVEAFQYRSQSRLLKLIGELNEGYKKQKNG